MAQNLITQKIAKATTTGKTSCIKQPRTNQDGLTTDASGTLAIKQIETA